MAKQWSFERRFPTKHARELADLATDSIPETEPMHVFIDTWLATYRGAGGVEKRPD